MGAVHQVLTGPNDVLCFVHATPVAQVAVDAANEVSAISVAKTLIVTHLDAQVPQAYWVIDGILDLVDVSVQHSHEVYAPRAARACPTAHRTGWPQ